MATKKEDTPDQFAHVITTSETVPGTDAPSHTELKDHSNVARLEVEDVKQPAQKKDDDGTQT